MEKQQLLELAKRKIEKEIAMDAIVRANSLIITAHITMRDRGSDIVLQALNAIQQALSGMKRDDAYTKKIKALSDADYEAFETILQGLRDKGE